MENEDAWSVQYLGSKYDVSRFRKFHPGGANTLSWFRNNDVTKQMDETEHSEAAYSLLQDYRVKAAKSAQEDVVDEVGNVCLRVLDILFLCSILTLVKIFWGSLLESSPSTDHLSQSLSTSANVLFFRSNSC